ncbi:MAG: hypothetical protein ABWK00_00170 [Desulfurococcaceae archaeon]
MEEPCDVNKVKERINYELQLNKDKYLAYVRENRLVELRLHDRKVGIWIFLGPRADYFIVPGAFCSCEDFLVRVIGRKSRCFCKHLVAQKLAEEAGRYRQISLESPAELVQVLNEILKMGFSVTARRRLLSRDGVGGRWEVEGERDTRK